MATLDVERVIRSPFFTSPCKLVAVKESTDAYGNPVWTETASADVQAVVTSDLRTMQRIPEALRHEGSILVRVMIADIPEGFTGTGFDEIHWRGRRFTVTDCADYSQFGKGFLRMICAPMEVDK